MSSLAKDYRSLLREIVELREALDSFLISPTHTFRAEVMIEVGEKIKDLTKQLKEGSV